MAPLTPRNRLIQDTDGLDAFVEKTNRGLLFTAEVYEDSSASDDNETLFLDYPTLDNERMIHGVMLTMRVNKDIKVSGKVKLCFSGLPAQLRILLPGSGTYLENLPSGLLYNGLIMTGVPDFNYNNFYIVSIGSYRLGGWGVDVDGGDWDNDVTEWDWDINGGSWDREPDPVEPPDDPMNNPVYVHNITQFSHQSISIDGNGGAASVESDLEQHAESSSAHNNIIIDGNKTEEDAKEDLTNLDYPEHAVNPYAHGGMLVDGNTT